MIKMLKHCVIFFCLMGVQAPVFTFVYLWEMREGSSRSCCLHYYGVDICNPYKPCSKFAKIDLAGIYNYISLLSKTEHAKLEPHDKILYEVKKYIESVLTNPHETILYQVPQYNSVKFYHDIIEADFLKSKDQKSAQAKAKKDPRDDFVSMYLVKLGLMQRRT